MSNKYIRPDGINRFQIRSANLGTLPSAWLDQEFNNIIKYLNGFVDSATINASEWKVINDNFTFETTKSFTVSGDLTGIFEPLRAIRFTDNNSGQAYSHIKACTYTADTDTTIVTVYDEVVPSTITEVAVGFLSEQATSIFSVKAVIVSNNYTVKDTDQILLIDDDNAITEMWEDNEVGETGTGKLSLLITLPNAADLKGKLLGVKKVAGNKQVIVSSQFISDTQYTDDSKLKHIYTYNSTIKGGEQEKNRVTLKGIGDMSVLFSDGANWYEITPNATEAVTGIVRFATAGEVTLSEEEVAEGKELRKDLAVSPYQVDQAYLRKDVRNTSFSSNFIYKAPNGVAAIVDNSIGLNVPKGLNDEGALKNEQIELDHDIVISNAEVSDKLKLLFIKSDLNWQEILAENFYISYEQPKYITAELGATIIWFDLGKNLLKQSIDQGSNWTTFDGAGPICQYYGNGANVTNILPYASVGFLTRDTLQNIYQQALNNIAMDLTAGVSKTAGNEYTAEFNGWVILILTSIANRTNHFYIDGVEVARPLQTDTHFGEGINLCFFIQKGQTYKYENSEFFVNSYNFYPCKGALK